MYVSSALLESRLQAVSFPQRRPPKGGTPAKKLRCGFLREILLGRGRLDGLGQRELDLRELRAHLLELVLIEHAAPLREAETTQNLPAVVRLRQLVHVEARSTRRAPLLHDLHAAQFFEPRD